MTSDSASTARRSDRLFLTAGITAFVAYFGARLLLKRPDVPFRLVIALLPIPFFVFFILAALRAARQLDELDRRIHLEAFAFAFPGIVVVLMTLGLLQTAGFSLSPEDWSYRHVWLLAMVFYVLGVGFARKRYQ